MTKKQSANSAIGQQGFTLVEVMIALVIFSIGVLGLAAMQINFIQGNATARGITEAANQASDKMEELMAPTFNYASVVSSNAPETVGDYTLNWVVTNPDVDSDSTPDTDYKHIQLTVTWNDSSDARSFTLDSMRVQAP